jgi:CBS domain-containing protein
MKVKEIMEPLTSWLTPEMSILQAILVMKRTKRGHGLSVNGIVVLDNDLKIVGMLSTKDILRMLIPSYMFLDEMNDDSASWKSMQAHRTDKANELRVRDLMTDDVRVIHLNDSIMRCADIMLAEHIHRLPVVGTDGRVLGSVHFRDVYNAVTNILCDTSATLQTA